MATVAGNTVYENFFLENQVEDQFNSHLDLQQFCTVDRTLEGTPGLIKKINVYSATNGTEKLEIGEGNTKAITVSYSPKSYEILLAQNKFEYNDEQALQDPMVVLVGMKHAGTDMFNTVNKDIYDEYANATLEVESEFFDFGAFVDAAAKLNIENLEDERIFGFVSPADMAEVRKNLKDDLKYVEAFSRNGYVGTVAGINLYTKKDATPGKIYIATQKAVTLFVKKGTEVEQSVIGKRSAADADIRMNTIFTRKYYLAALTDATKVVRIVKSEEDDNP